MSRTLILLSCLLLSNQIPLQSEQADLPSRGFFAGRQESSFQILSAVQEDPPFQDVSVAQEDPPFQDFSAGDRDSTGFQGGFCIPVRTDLQEESLAYRAGEHFDFSVHYTWGIINSDVGLATVDLDTLRYNGRKAFWCRVYGYTIRWYDVIFKVREDFQSWFTTDGLVPLKFTRDTREGKYAAKNTFNYIWNSADEPYIDAEVYSSRHGLKNVVLPLDRCTFDLPALFYMARNMDFDSVTPEERYPMTFAIDDDVYNVYFIMKTREELKLKGIGTIKTIKFAAKLIAGTVFTGETDMMIWVTDDDNRIPVYFEAPILVGTASGRLAGYSGLKHEFTSLVRKSKK